MTGSGWSGPRLLELFSTYVGRLSRRRQFLAEIRYEYEETERGARVRITTANVEALSAVHEFLRFQIEDHETGDPTEVRPPV